MSPALYVTLAIVIAVVVALAAFVVVRRLRSRAALDRREAEREPGFPAPALHPEPKIRPIVLVHGVLGFDHLSIMGQRIAYFRGVTEVLEANGAAVYTAGLPALASVPERARALAEYVHSLPCERVNLVAHSMGGLDSRYAIAQLGLAGKVESLITIATPHRGTPLADLMADIGHTRPLRALRCLVGQIGINTAAIDWLTTAKADELNRAIDDIEGIYYGCIVGRARRQAILTNPVLLSGHLYIASRAGENDGMVPASSQYWGEICDEIAADHFAQIGWSTYYETGDLYRRLVATLRRNGL